MNDKRYLFFGFILTLISSLPLRLLAQQHRLPPFQPEQETCNALTLCGGYFYTPYSYTGYGHVQEEFQGGLGYGGGCHSENNSVWFRLDIVTSGNMIFKITPDNPKDDYDFTIWDGTQANCLYIHSYSYQRLRCNGNTGFGTDGSLGLSDTAQQTRIEGGADAQGMLKALEVTAGNFYYILVDNFTGSTSGFSIDFTGSTAVFKSSGDQPKYLFTIDDSTCGYGRKLGVSLSRPIQCSSIAADGSDFEIVPALANVVSAIGNNCVGLNGYTTRANLVFDKTLSAGKYILRSKKGTDNNTLLDLCSGEQQLEDEIAFEIQDATVVPLPKYMDTIRDTTCDKARKLNIKMSTEVLCNSIAGNGSDFMLEPAVATIVSATGIDCIEGRSYSTGISILFSKDLPVGNYILKPKKGDDGNSLISLCGGEQLLSDEIAFTVDDALVFKPIPKYESIIKDTSCERLIKVKVKMSAQMQCSSIAKDGSDFEIIPALADIVAADGSGCSDNQVNASDISISFNKILPAGTYILRSKKGTDNNVLIDKCGVEQLPADEIKFTILQTFKYNATTPDTCKTTKKLNVRFSRPLMCSSIAADGSDFEIEPAIANVISAVGKNCNSSQGNAGGVQLTFSRSLPVGTYFLHAKKGTDNNILLDICGQEQLSSDKFPFDIDNAGFSVSAGADTAICAGNSLQLMAKTTSGKNTLQWTPADFLSDPAILNPVAKPVDNVAYIVTAIPNNLTESCAQRDTIQVTVLKGIDILNSDTTICKGGEVVIKTSGANDYSYSWSPADFLSDPVSGNPTAAPNRSVIYTVTASRTGCKDVSASFGIKVLEGFEISTPDTILCSTAPVTIEIAGDTEFSYNWSPPDYLSGTTGMAQTATPYRATTYTVTASYPGCKDSTQTIRVSLRDWPLLITSDTIVCEGQSVPLQVTGNGLFSFRWEPLNSLSSATAQSPVALPDVTTSYVFTASYPGCKDSVQTVEITVEPVPEIAPLSPQTVCEGNTILLNPSISPASYNHYSFQWRPAAAFNNPTIKNPVYKAIGDVTVSLIVSTINGCADTLSQLIPASLPPTVNAGPDKITSAGTPVLLEGEAGNSATVFQWRPALYLSANNMLKPTANPPATQVFILSATTQDGCENSDSMLVTVLKHIYVPAAFSPNGDGLNDVWNIPGLSIHADAGVRVFNRWGQFVFESKGYAKPWDGIFKGKQLPVGVYYYVITINGNGYGKLTGSLTLLR